MMMIMVIISVWRNADHHLSLLGSPSGSGLQVHTQAAVHQCMQQCVLVQGKSMALNKIVFILNFPRFVQIKMNSRSFVSMSTKIYSAHENSQDTRMSFDLFDSFTSYKMLICIFYNIQCQEITWNWISIVTERMNTFCFKANISSIDFVNVIILL